MKQSLKKLFIIPLAVAVLASCGNNSSPSKSESNPPAPSTSQVPAPSTSTENVIHVEGIRLDKTTAELTVGSELNLVATVTPENATDKSYTFSSSNTAVATVTNEGKVSAVAVGQATITVVTTDGKKTATCSITVKEGVVAVESVAFIDAEASLYLGETKTLNVTVLPEAATNKAVTFASSNTEVATVDETGKVTALKVGEATITATSVDGNKTAACHLVVKDNVYTFCFNDGTETGATSLTRTINKDKQETDQISLTVSKNGTEWLDAEVEVTTGGDTGVITVAENDNSYGYDVTITGVGTASITFTLKGVDGVSPITVNYVVNECFLNQNKDLIRGSVTEANNQIVLGTAGQPAALVKKADTKWVFKTKATIEKYTGGDSVGVGGFLDSGDHALWFGLRNSDGKADNISNAYIRDFYEGWGNAKFDRAPDYYDNLAFDETEDGNGIALDFEVIRNGVDYYYNIGGRHGKYTSNTARSNEASYPGFFSQNKNVTFTNYSVDYTQEAVDAAITASYNEDTALIDAAKFNKPNLTEIVREQSREFEYGFAPSYSKEALTLVADETYAAHVSIEGKKITIGKDAPNGTLNLSLKSASGKTLDTIQIPVREVSSEKSNEQLTVKGGVQLSDTDGSIFFPESMMNVNGVGNEQAYDSTKEYGAILKQTVLGGDFTLEFDVTGYKASVNFPKLMVSLGGNCSQFYIACGYGGGTKSRIETFTYSKQVYAGQWNNTEDFPEDFDPTATHHYKIESKNGFYNFYLDGAETPLNQQMDGQLRNIIVPIDSYAKELPVRISTNGVSAKVSNIQVKTGKVADLQKVAILGERTTLTEEGGYLMTMKTGTGDAWDYHRSRKNLAVYPQAYLDDLTAGYKATFNVTFSRMMTDGKVIVGFGKEEFHICNSTNDDWKKIQEVTAPSGWGANFCGIDLSAEKLTLPVTIVNDGKGNVTFSVPKADGTTINVPSKVNGLTADMPMYFFTFNNNADDNDCTATISDIKVEALETVTA